MNIKTEMI